MYSLRSEPVSLIYDVSSLVDTGLLVNCGAYEFTLTTSEGSAIDSDKFVDSEGKFTVISTDDLELVNTYSFIYSIKMENYPFNAGVKSKEPFVVNIVNPCDEPVSLDAPSELDRTVIDYALTSPPVMFTFDKFI